MVLVFANWFEARLILIGDLVTGGGTLIFPLTFLLADVLTEVYGYKQTRRAIWAGFLFNILFVAYGYLITLLPGPDFYQNNTYFNEIIHIDARIMLASLVSYLCSEPLNATLIAKLKVKTKGQHMAFRFVFSTVIASGVDSVLFNALAFYNTMPLTKLVNFTIVLWLLKVVIEVIGLPFSVYLAKKLKKFENLDIYDDSTNFTLFSFEASYDDLDNHNE